MTTSHDLEPCAMSASVWSVIDGTTFPEILILVWCGDIYDLSTIRDLEPLRYEKAIPRVQERATKIVACLCARLDFARNGSVV